MPAHLDYSGEPGSQRSVAWLRFIKQDGGRIRAALFETTASGEPLGFLFTRADLSVRDDRAYRERLRTVAMSLFRALERSPSLALGLADEMPARVFEGGRRDGTRFVAVESDPSDAENMMGELWNSTILSNPSSARADACRKRSPTLAFRK